MWRQNQENKLTKNYAMFNSFIDDLGPSSSGITHMAQSHVQEQNHKLCETWLST